MIKVLDQNPKANNDASFVKSKRKAKIPPTHGYHFKNKLTQYDGCFLSFLFVHHHPLLVLQIYLLTDKKK